jgi:radical SAM superfamily enzyme YgiQ (UPF0313 family)
MRVALIDTPAPQLWEDKLEPNLGLLYLATFLKVNNHEVKLIDLRGITKDKWEHQLKIENIEKFDLCGFSTYTPTFNITLEILKLVKEMNENIISVAGGPHATALPKEVKNYFDYVIRNEGEIALLELVNKIEYGKAPRKKIIEGKPIMNLDDLPFPDYSLCDIFKYKRHIYGKKCLSILSSRGCPYSCRFCNSIILGAGKIPRFRSPENIVREITMLKENYHVEAFRFNDDLFTMNYPRLKKINELLKLLDIIYRCFGRVNHCSKKVAEILANGGCKHISFGVESGSQKILDLMNKQQTIKDIKEGIKNAKKAGLIVRAYLIVGFPGETWETVKETVNLMLECMPDEIEVYNFIPYPGTYVFNYPEKFGITFIDRDWSKYWQTIGDKDSGYVFRTKYLNEETIKNMRFFIIEKLLSNGIKWAGESKKFK